MLEWHVISLLIHGFLSVNARLLIAFGTAFYAIITVVVVVVYNNLLPSFYATCKAASIFEVGNSVV